MEATELVTFKVDDFIAILLGSVAGGAALAGLVAMIVHDWTSRDDTDPVLAEELAALRSARRVRAAATRAGHAMRRIRDDQYQDYDPPETGFGDETGYYDDEYDADLDQAYEGR